MTVILNRLVFQFIIRWKVNERQECLKQAGRNCEYHVARFIENPIRRFTLPNDKTGNRLFSTTADLNANFLLVRGCKYLASPRG